MKRLVALVCAGMLVFSTAACVFAQPSKEVNGPVDLNDDDLYLDDVSDEDKDVVNKMKENLKDILGDQYDDDMKVLDVKEVKGEKDFPAKVTFDVLGVKEGSKVAILLYNRETGEWEVLDAVAGNGTITVELPYASLIAFIVDGQVVSTVSPKTGDLNVGLYAGMIAMIALAGMGVVAVRSKRA